MSGPFENVTWRCHICGDERPDDKISVFQHDISEEHNLPAGTVQENVRYCNDRDSCRNAAPSHRLTARKTDYDTVHGRLESSNVGDEGSE